MLYCHTLQTHILLDPLLKYKLCYVHVAKTHFIHEQESCLSHRHCTKTVVV